jgi:hypothetical protein
MNRLLVVIAVLALGFTGCKKCKNEDPRARVLNNGTENVSVYIQSSGGSKVHLYCVDGGQASYFESYAAGMVGFTVTVGNGNDSTNYSKAVSMEECYQYDIVLDANNTITFVPTDMND